MMQPLTAELDQRGQSLGSEPYQHDNLLDRLTSASTREVHYRHLARREQKLLAERLNLSRGEVLSVGCGWHPGRHLFPSPSFRLTAVDADTNCVAAIRSNGSADEAFAGHAGKLDLPPHSFDVILYRAVLHHIAFQGPLGPCFTEAASVLRPGGTLIVIEPGLWHPVGLALSLANRWGIATAVHGTPDDVPLSPHALAAEARSAGLMPEIHSLTYTWRRMPKQLQGALHPLDDALGSRRRAARFGHTLLVIARKPSGKRTKGNR
jgi:SAM-dependent methyltransferase